MLQRILTILIILCAGVGQVTAQAIDTTIVIRVVDLRTASAETAVLSAIQASKKQVIIVMIQNGGTDLITQTENDVRGLIHSGYKRIVLVLGQGFTDEPESIVSIYSGGHTFALIKDVSKSAQTSSDLFKLVRDAYEEYIDSEQ